MTGTATTQAEDLALCFVKLHEVQAGPALKHIQVPVDDILSLPCNCITQFGDKLANLLRECSVPSLCYCSEKGQVADPSIPASVPMLSRALVPGQADQEDLDIMAENAALVKDSKERNREGRLQDGSGGT